MANGYLRQSVAQIAPGVGLTSAAFNNEYNAIQGAFDSISGHNHDGTSGGGAPIPLGGSAVTGILPASKGGTGLAGVIANGIPVGAGASAMTYIVGSQYQVLVAGASGIPSFGQVNVGQSAAVTGVLATANGGTGQSTFTDGQLLIGNSSTGSLSKATISAGSGVTVTNGNGTITISAITGTGGGGAQAYDAGLTSLAALSSTGIIVQSVADTFVARTLTAPSAGLTITNADGTIGNPTFALANDLAAIEALNSNGIPVRTGTDTWTSRSITGTINQISVANGDGIAGNPVISLPSTIDLTGKAVTGGITALGLGNVVTLNAGVSANNVVQLNGSAQIPAVDGSLVTSIIAPPQGRLVLNGSILTFQRYNGSRVVMPNGAVLNIPSSGVTVSSPGAVTLNGVGGSLTNGVVYYVYLYNNSGSLAIDFSTTAWIFDTNTGLPIKNGDNTRLLVGMVRPVGGLWVDSSSQKFVVSYWQRLNKDIANYLTTNRSVSSSSMGEVHSEIRCEFLSWGDEGVFSSMVGRWFADTTGVGYFASLAVDGLLEDAGTAAVFSLSTASAPLSLNNTRTYSEGYHYITLFGATAGSGTVTFVGGSAASQRCGIHCMIRG